MPIGVQMASYAIQGITLAATEKSVTDHGISAIAQRDCALWRGLTGEPVCKDVDDLDGAIAIAAINGDTDANTGFMMADTVGAAEPAVNLSPPVVAVTEPQFAVMELVDFATAAGDDVVSANPVTAIQTAAIQTAAIQDETAPLTVPPQPAPAANAGHLYFIIGSFHTTDRAMRLADRHPGLSPEIVRAQAKGRTVYRVAVGPFAPHDTGSERQRLAAAGVTSAWAIPYDPGRWEPVENPAKVALNVAALAQ